MSRLIDVVSKFMGDTTKEVEIHEYFAKDLPLLTDGYFFALLILEEVTKNG